MGEIYTVGIAHNDRDGSEKLNGVLEKVKPDLVLIEGFSKFFEARSRFLHDVENIFTRAGLPESIVKRHLVLLKASAYEYDTSLDYALKNGVAYDYFNDSFNDPRVFLAIRKGVQRALSTYKTNPDVLSSFEAEVEAKAKEADESLSDVSRWVAPKFGTALEEREARLVTDAFGELERYPERDEKMEAGLRAKASELKEGSIILTITGLAHLIRTKVDLTFYDKIQDLNPKRIFLLNPPVWEGVIDEN